MKIDFLFALVLLGIVAGCRKADPEIPNEEELITSLKYSLTSISGGDIVIFTFTDADGDGGLEPEIYGGTLTKNSIYLGRLELLNETQNPAINITAEIEDEDEAHQFFFKPASGLNLVVTYEDADANGSPVGLKSKVQSGLASTGKLTITLRHAPDKSGAGVSGGDIANAGGETDLELSFDVIIQ